MCSFFSRGVLGEWCQNRTLRHPFVLLIWFKEVSYSCSRTTRGVARAPLRAFTRQSDSAVEMTLSTVDDYIVRRGLPLFDPHVEELFREGF